MKIRELYLEGFGHFQDKRFGPFDSPLVVLHGPNEAGKSTLLHFIRTMLFGFPLRNRDSHYPPLSGGRHGGRITLTDSANNVYVVERLAGPRRGNTSIKDGSGAPLDSSLLSSLLRDAPEDVFKNVFAFSLDELESDSLLKNANVNGGIYSAGMGASRLPDALKSFENRMTKLYLRSGSVQDVAKLVSELQEVDSQLGDLRDNAAEYGRLVTRREEISAELERIDEGRRNIETRRSEVSKLMQAWDGWVELAYVEEQLAASSVFEGFPDDAINRLERAEENVQPALKELDQTRDQLESTKAEVEAPIPDETMLDDADQIAQITRGSGSFDDSVGDLPKRQIELRALEDNLSQRLRILGPDWDEKRLESFDLSMAVLDQIDQHQQSLSNEQENVRSARNERERSEKNLSELKVAESEARDELDRTERPPLDSAQVMERRADLRTARTRYQEYDAMRQRHTDYRNRLDSLTTEQGEPASVPANQNRALALILAVSGVAIAVLGAILGGQSLILGGVAGLLLLVIAGYVFMKKAAPPRDSSSAEAESLKGLVRQTSEDETEATERLQESSSPLELDLPDAAELDNFEAQLELNQNLLGSWEALSQRLKESIANVQRQERRLEAESKALEDAESNLARSTEDWKAWLSRVDLPRSFTPETMVMFRGQVDTALEGLNGVKDRRQRVEAIKVDIREYQELVSPLAKQYALPVSAAEGQIAVAATLLKDRLEEAKNQATQRDAAVKHAQEARQTHERRKKQWEESQQHLSDLLETGGAQNAEDFRQRASQHIDRLSLEKERDTLVLGLQRISGPGAAFDQFKKALEQTDQQLVNDEQREMSIESEALEESREELLNEQGRIDIRVDQLGSEEESSVLRARRNVLMEDLRQNAAQWSTLKFAEELLNRARQKFEKERQPGVIRHAQKFFATVTSNRYERVYAPIGKQTVSVIDGTGVEKLPDALSRGTCEQLYLALRFGLIREFGERAESLPVVVDEILVNFDPDRALRAAEAFAELSRTNQVLVFTCHPHIVELFKLASPDAKVIDIGQG